MMLNCFVQNGASLESLARGVVSFSRRYSLEELTEHWSSILYDSDDAEEAAAAMAKFEFTKYHGNKIKEVAKKVASPKEKTQNICKQFNAMQKKIHKEVNEEDENIKKIRQSCFLRPFKDK
ncbi:hypothetical protein P8452_55454 [Trifolium repens]|nr:hypothetical protein P8452_55454 [Trifolium repens]